MKGPANPAGAIRHSPRYEPPCPAQTRICLTTLSRPRPLVQHSALRGGPEHAVLATVSPNPVWLPHRALPWLGLGPGLGALGAPQIRVGHGPESGTLHHQKAYRRHGHGQRCVDHGQRDRRLSHSVSLLQARLEHPLPGPADALNAVPRLRHRRHAQKNASLPGLYDLAEQSHRRLADQHHAQPNTAASV